MLIMYNNVSLTIELQRVVSPPAVQSPLGRSQAFSRPMRRQRGPRLESQRLVKPLKLRVRLSWPCKRGHNDNKEIQHIYTCNHIYSTSIYIYTSHSSEPTTQLGWYNNIPLS